MLTYKLITILCVILFIIYRKLKKIYTYWERRGVKGIKPIWFVGNVLPMLRRKETLESLMQNIYNIYPNEKAFGMYIGALPTLVLKDLALVKTVLITEFSSFPGRSFKMTEEKLIDSLFFEKGELWKLYRKKLTPLFSTGKMRSILPELTEYTDLYLNYIEELPPKSKELKQLVNKLSVRITMATSFGLKNNNFNEDFDMSNVGDVLYFPARLAIGTLLYGFNHKLPSAIGFKIIPEKFVDTIVNKCKEEKKQNPREDENAFDYIVKLKDQGVVKKHKNDGVIEIAISDSVVPAHAAVFLSTGMETYSNSSFLLFELSKRQDIQERCYREIEQVMEKYNGDLNIEAIDELQYLNMAFMESLRMYPNAGALSRIAEKDYYFKEIDLNIKKGTPIIIPVQAIHYDPENFPNPEEFNPERFSPENKIKIKECSYLPFGEGPRKCIGLRLAKVQSILLLAKFLHRFKVTPCAKTVHNLRFSPLLLSLHAEKGLWVNITKHPCKEAEILRMLRYLQARKLQRKVLRFIPIDLRQLISLCALCTTYFIVIVQFTHLDS